MSLGTILSRVLGMARDMVLAAFFPRLVTDAFVVAFRLPNMFRRLLGEGSLAVSFIPVYIERMQEEGEATLKPGEGASLANALFTLLVVAVSLLSVLGTIYMEPILNLLVSGKGFQQVPGKIEVTVVLGRIMFSYLFLVMTYAFFMAIANAHKKFLIPALAPAVFNFVVILSAFLPSGEQTLPGKYLAWGVLVGGVVQVLLVGGQLVRMHLLPRLTLRCRVKGVATVLTNMIPGLLGMGVLQLMTLVNVQFASRLEQGTHSYIYWADRILELPQSLIAISLGAALLPQLSRLWVQGQAEKMRETAQHHLKLLLFLATPSAVGMYVLSLPIIEVLFMRGQFQMKDAQQTALVVEIYSFLLVASSLNKVAVPSFYAIKNTWLPALVSVISLTVHIILANAWVDLYGLKGLVGSTAVSGFLNVTLTLIFYRWLIGPLGIVGLLKAMLSYLPGLIALGLSAHYIYWGSLNLINSFLPLTFSRVISLGLSICSAGLLYFLIARVLRVEEGMQVLGLLRRKARR